MRAAIYARVSLDLEAEDKRFQDPENQLNPLKKWAEAMNFEVTGTYVDKASGGDSNRPEFKKMRTDAHQHKFGSILVWSLDRFSREGVGHTLSYLEELRKYGIGVRSYQEQWLDTDPANPMSEIILAVLAWAAKFERWRISQRTKAAIARRRLIGQWRGGRPKGSKDSKPRKKREG